MALECDAFGGNSIGIRRRRPPNGPKRPEFRPRRVCRFTRRSSGRVLLVRGNCLLQAVASLRASASLVGALVTGRVRAISFCRARFWGGPAGFVSRRFLPVVGS